jgi:hypothetical protein
MVKLDKFRQQEIDLRRMRMATQLANSKKRVQYQLENQGIYNTPTPSAMQTDYETELNDPEIQLKQADENTNKLLNDKNQAAILLNLLVENDYINEFNFAFNKIYREIKTNYTNLSGIDAYNLFLGIIKSKPLETSTFVSALTEIRKQIIEYIGANKNNKKEVSLAETDLLKLDAVTETYNNVDDDTKEYIEANIDPSSIENISNAVDGDFLNKIFQEIQSAKAGENSNTRIYISDLNEIRKQIIDYIDDNKNNEKEVSLAETDLLKLDALIETYNNGDDNTKEYIEANIDPSSIENISDAVNDDFLNKLFQEQGDELDNTEPTPYIERIPIGEKTAADFDIIDIKRIFTDLNIYEKEFNAIVNYTGRLRVTLKQQYSKANRNKKGAEKILSYIEEIKNNK